MSHSLGEPDHLTLAEAIHLAHGLVAEAAAQAGVRALFIKGLSYEAHGLRPPRVPADVDVLVAPDDIGSLLQILQACGWRPRKGHLNDYPLPVHSVTMLHDHWPCDIDIHHEFPGFFAPPLRRLKRSGSTASLTPSPHSAISPSLTMPPVF